MKRNYYALGLVVALMMGAPSASAATWDNYHWARTTPTFTLTVESNVSSDWQRILKAAARQWSDSAVLDIKTKRQSGDREDCVAAAGTITVCNAEYGLTGWLGLTTISTDGDHITNVQIKINDTYFALEKYDTSSWRHSVMCHELGHALGLAHADEDFSTAGDSCVDVLNDPTGSQEPSQENYETLEALYAHLDNYDSYAPHGRINSGRQHSVSQEAKLERLRHPGRI